MTVNKNNPIGFFDSGVGGLTVLKEFRNILPNEDGIYFGDTKNMPYGEKSKEQLIEYSKYAFEFFEKQGVKAVVMACNTTSATVYDILKNDYSFKLYPIIQSVTKLLSGLQVDTIGVFATQATVNSHAYSKGIKSFSPGKNIIEIACPDWVKIVENHEENSQEALGKIKEKLSEMLEFSPERIVLGCTHYPFLLPQLSQIADKELFINPAEAFVKFIKADLEFNHLLSENPKNGSDIFYTSSSVEQFVIAGGMFYNLSNAVVKLI